jgi:hypothetical protein
VVKPKAGEVRKMQCSRCGRKLKNPKYQKLGFGKVCYGKHVAEAAKAKAKEVEKCVEESEGKDRT